MLRFLATLDHRLFLLINGLGCRPLDVILGDLTVMGNWTVSLVAFARLYPEGTRRLLRHAAVLVLLLVPTWGASKVLKGTVKRDRPTVTLREGAVPVRVLGEPLRMGSFPSGHAMLGFYFMTYLALHDRRDRLWALLLASLLALSRVYVGVHFPSDVLGGGALGALGGWAAWRLHAVWERRRPARDAASGTGEA